MRTRRLPVLFFFAASLAFCQDAFNANVEVDRLRVEDLKNPMGIDAGEPRLSWRLMSENRGERQTAYRVLVASSAEKLDPENADIWDSRKMHSNRNYGVVYRGKPLRSGGKYYWTVRVWDAAGRPSEWSDPGVWTMGLLERGDWEADWISYRDERVVDASRNERVYPHPRYYRSEFEAVDTIVSATLYATALGNYDVEINGRPVTHSRFLPGWTDYRERVYYNTFDVTEFLESGSNAIGAIVADGWYAGYLGLGPFSGHGPNRSGRYIYGKTPALKLQLALEYEDGRKVIIGTDETWKVGTGAYLRADMLMGETYDARLQPAGWSRVGFDDSAWDLAVHAEENGELPATFTDHGGERTVDLGFREPKKLQAYPMQPVRPIEEMAPVSITEREDGLHIVDFGQNFTGVVRLALEGSAGDEVRIRHGEMLHLDGSLMTENLRSVEATNFYVLRGDEGGEVYEPRFTFHGFRYAEIKDYPGELTKDKVRAVVLHSDTPMVSEWESSDPVLNRFYKNVLWTQRSNFLELPTDCPQRDERLGWTGDAQVYARAAMYNADVNAFFRKWFVDLRDAQREDGGFPDFAPYPYQHGRSGKPYATAWTDAGMIVPWAHYEFYGDKEVLRRHYHSMRRFIDFRLNQGPDFTGTRLGNAWGDWLAIGEETPIEFIDHCYYAGSLEIMTEVASELCREDDFRKYADALEKVRENFVRDYVRGDGTLTVDTQTAYVLALWFDLIPGEKRFTAADRLAEKIIENDRRMSTGFLGTRPLLFVLTDTGHFELAVELMQSRRFPSWLFPVEQGATTVWERWDGYSKADGFQNPRMNSFNHYAFGAVVEWMFEILGGIGPAEPGFGKIIIAPRVPREKPQVDVPPLNSLRARYDSIQGVIESEWRIEGTRFELHATIPANSVAEIRLPSKSLDTVRVDGRIPGEVQHVEVLKHEEGRITLEVGSGRYGFTTKLPN